MQNKKEKAFGVVLIFKDASGDFLFCLVRAEDGHWGFPKGHQDIGESEKETALRELKEETGVSGVKFLSDESFLEVYSFERDGIRYDKSVKYFLGFVSSMDTVTPDSFKQEISELKWLSYKDTKELLTFPEPKVMLDQVVEYLKPLEK